MGLMLSLERELAQSDEGRNIRLSTVCPAILSKGFECTGLPFLSTWFPSIFPSMDVQVAAQEVVTRILREDDVIILPASFSLMHRLSLPHRILGSGDVAVEGRVRDLSPDHVTGPSPESTSRSPPTRTSVVARFPRKSPQAPASGCRPDGD
ncbi:hypothetical protein HPB47_022079 [Ixodes persulcatus]|uniref:Uncharacterized protein n=1 Tax=Ixodes persulcatus TaxID=34615 RepID=A0AC60QD99_IXOPE|nr:hypothetical protein HPB47_022079 [Ixodes persulcatus]